MNIDPDKLTDYVAIFISTGVTVSIWGLFLYDYLYLPPIGAVPSWLMYAAIVMTLVSAITLFGFEKVSKAIDLKTQ